MYCKPKDKKLILFILIWLCIIGMIAIINLFAELHNLQVLHDICMGGAFFVSGWNLRSIYLILEKKNGGICNKTK